MKALNRMTCNGLCGNRCNGNSKAKQPSRRATGSIPVSPTICLFDDFISTLVRNISILSPLSIPVAASSQLDRIDPTSLGFSHEGTRLRLSDVPIEEEGTVCAGLWPQSSWDWFDDGLLHQQSDRDTGSDPYNAAQYLWCDGQHLARLLRPMAASRANDNRLSMAEFILHPVGRSGLHRGPPRCTPSPNMPPLHLRLCA